MTQASSTDTVVSYSVAGTATPTSDYTPLTGTVTIFAGQLSHTIKKRDCSTDMSADDVETVVVTLTAISSGDPQITLDPVAANKTATVTILDNDTATVSDRKSVV